VLKYDREIIQMDMFTQISSTSEKKAEPAKKNRTTDLTDQFTDCVKDSCPCKKAAVSKSLKLIAEDKKKKCAVGGMSCPSQCGHKIISNDIVALTGVETAAAAASKKSLLQKDFPLHSVKINAFSKGAMNLDQCMKFCLSSTCGCADAPGFPTEKALKDAVKQNAAIGGVTDTPKSPQYRKAKIEECAKGMIGKKVASDLYIKLKGGPGGMYEVCSKDFLSKILGPSGDIAGMTAKCKSGASDDAKFGCLCIIMDAVFRKSCTRPADSQPARSPCVEVTRRLPMMLLTFAIPCESRRMTPI